MSTTRLIYWAQLVLYIVVIDDCVYYLRFKACFDCRCIATYLQVIWVIWNTRSMILIFRGKPNTQQLIAGTNAWDLVGVTVRYDSITKTRLFKYIESLNTKNWKFSDKNSDILYISAQNINCGDPFEPPRRAELRNKKNNIYPCKPQFYYIKVGFKGFKII